MSSMNTHPSMLGHPTLQILAEYYFCYIFIIDAPLNIHQGSTIQHLYLPTPHNKNHIRPAPKGDPIQ